MYNVKGKMEEVVKAILPILHVPFYIFHSFSIRAVRH
jgi:hypothetical protein